MIKWLAGKLWFYKIEGMPCYNGLNVYRKDDPSSSGFVLKLGHLYFQCRYSKRINKWLVRFYWAKPSYTTYKI